MCQFVSILSDSSQDASLHFPALGDFVQVALQQSQQRTGLAVTKLHSWAELLAG